MMRGHLGLAVTLVATWFGAIAPVLANPDPSDPFVLTLRDGRELSGPVQGERLRFQTSLDTLPVSIEKILSLSDGALDLAGIGEIEGSFVSGDFVIETPEGRVRQPAADVVAIRGVSVPYGSDAGPGEASAPKALSQPTGVATPSLNDDERRVSVRVAIQLSSDGSGTSRQEVSLPPSVASEVAQGIREGLQADSPAGAQITEQTDPGTGKTAVAAEFPFETLDALTDRTAAYHFTRARAGFFQARYSFEAELLKRPSWPLTLRVTLPGKISQTSGQTVSADTVEWRYDPGARASAAQWSAESSGLSPIGLLHGSGLGNHSWLSPERTLIGGIAAALLLAITTFALRHHIRMPKLPALHLPRRSPGRRVAIAQRFCTKCGAPIMAGKRFCTGCGAAATSHD